MTMYLGDLPVSGVVDFNWSTNNGSGASITRATNGTVSVYKSNSVTQTTTGVTDTEDFDGLTGIHHCRIDTSTDGTFYAAGNEFSVVLSAATIDGQTVNSVLAHFSVERGGGALALIKNATYGLSAIKTLVDDLETRLTAARAGYLDNLSGGGVALASALATLQTLVDDLETRLSAARSGYLDNLSGGAVATASALATAVTYIDTEVANILSTVTSILTAVDTEIAAMKAKTDQMSFTSGDLHATLNGETVLVSDKTGFKLAADGLDTISTAAPTGVAGNFREMIVTVWRLFFRRVTETADDRKTYADDGTTVLTTQALSDNGTTQTQGPAS